MDKNLLPLVVLLALILIVNSIRLGLALHGQPCTP